MSAKNINYAYLYAEGIHSNIVKMIAGDSFEAALYLNSGTILTPARYTLTDNDKVYFGVSEVNHSFMESIIRKTYTKDSTKTSDGDLVITLDPSDTESLEPGVYYYTVKVVTTTIDSSSGTAVEKEEVNTVMPSTLFYIMQ